MWQENNRLCSPALRKKHWSTYVANKAAIERCPRAFAVSEDNAAQIKVIKTHISNRNTLSSPAVQQHTASQPSITRDRVYMARRQQVKTKNNPP